MDPGSAPAGADRIHGDAIERAIGAYAGAIASYCRRLLPPDRVDEAIDATFAAVLSLVNVEDPASALPEVLIVTRRIASSRLPVPATAPGSETCVAMSEQLVLRREGSLSAADAQSVDAHLRTCERCQGLSAAMEEAERAFGAPAPPTRALREHLRDLFVDAPGFPPPVANGEARAAAPPSGAAPAELERTWLPASLSDDDVGHGVVEEMAHGAVAEPHDAPPSEWDVQAEPNGHPVEPAEAEPEAEAQRAAEPEAETAPAPDDQDPEPRPA